MASNNPGSAVTYFGRRMRKERAARGWSLREMAAKTAINYATLSRVETGRQPPTEKLAIECDRVFESDWFLSYYEESKSWVPAGFRNWSEYEDKATTLRVWHPTTVHGLAQVSSYARVMLSVYPGVGAEAIETRLKERMTRQQRVLLRPDNPPETHLIIDETALYRRVGSAAVMAEQCAHLLELAQADHIRLQISPAVENPCTGSEMIITGDAAYAESLAGGGTHTSPEVRMRLGKLFATLAGECYRLSESLAMVERMHSTWTELGASLPTQAATAAAASKRPAPTALSSSATPRRPKTQVD
jgi:transcriptional regulator with XRE-family HTH domain